MTPRTAPTLLRAVLAGLVVSACGSDAKDAPPAAAASMRHSCTIQLSRRAEEYRGSASGDDEGLAEQAAWTDVCGKLPEAERTHCRDEAKYSVMKASGSSTIDGKTSFNVNLTLTARHPIHEGHGESQTAKDEACELALAEACKAADASGDCLAGGEYVKQGQSTSSRRAGV